MTGQGRAVALVLALAASASIAYAQVGSVAHFAGGPGAVGFTDGNAWDARFSGVRSVAVDPGGTVYAGCSSGAIRAIASGSVSTVTYAGDAEAMALAGGSLYAINGNGIQKITLPAGTVSLFAGSYSTPGSTNGAVLDARFNSPRGIAADAAGTNLFVADTLNYTIRKVPLTGGSTTTLAGTPLQSGAVNATGSSARFRFPTSLAVDPTTGDVIVGDATMLRRVTQGGVVTTIAGVDGVHALVDGALAVARFVAIRGVAVDATGQIFVSDAGRIREIAAGTVSTFSGTDVPGNSSYVGIDGGAHLANYFYPQGLAVDASGQLFVADENSVRRTDTFGNITTIAGPSAYAGSRDGFPDEARFFYPRGVAYRASSSNVYVADSGFGFIRRILPSGYVSTLTDGTGTPLFIDLIRRIAIDQGTGTLYVTSARNIVQRITPAGVMTTLAGMSGATGSTDDIGSAARFDDPMDLAVDTTGNIYVADTGNNTIRKITPAGVVTTLAGLAGSSGMVDATGSAARFNAPVGITYDPFSNALYVAESTAIRKVTLGGAVTTFAGSAAFGTVDGTGPTASFAYPRDVEADGLGNLYVTGSGTIRIVSSTRVVQTLTGPGYGSSDGVGSAAQFGDDFTAAFDSSRGRLLIADPSNHNLRQELNSVAYIARIDAPAGPVGSYRFLSASPDTAWSYAWSVAQRPAGSTAALTSDASSQTLFTPDAEGPYVFSLSASSPQGSSTTSVPFTACNEGSVTITAPQTPICSGATASASVPDQGSNAIYSWTILDGKIVSGAGTRSIQFTPDANGFNFTIRVTIILANGCTLSGQTGIMADLPQISSTKRSYSAAERLEPVSIDFYGSCPWSATSSSPWITFTTATSGSGRGSVTYKVAANTSGSRREGSVTVAGVNIPITQSALDAPLTVNFFAGPTGGADSRDGNGTSARFVEPDSISSDASGNLYVFDDFTIRRISPAGAVTTLAGLSGTGGDIDGTRGKARFNGSGGPIVAAPNGTLYVNDSPLLKRITAGGTVSLFADSRTNPSMLRPMCADASGNLYAQGPDAKVVKITPAGAVSAYVQLPYTIVAAAIDVSGNLYVVQQYGSGIEKVTPSGTITPFAGTGGCSATDLCYGIEALAADGSGNFFASSGSRIYKITAAGAITLLAGTGAQGYSDGSGATAVFNYPKGIAAGGGNVYAAESWNHCIRRVDASNNVSTFAGLGIVYGSTDGTGTASRFNGITAGATDSSGNLYVDDTYNHTIRKITPAGVASVFAGATGQPGSTNANGTSARFNYPAGIAIDRAAGIVYVADSANYTIRKITMTRDVTTFAGMVGSPGPTNATGTSAQFLSPSALTLDESTGDLYVVDDTAIRRVTKAGVVTTIKSGLDPNSGSHVIRIAFDPVSKKLFYANETLFILSLDGTLTPFAGQPNGYRPIDGTGSSAQFSDGIRDLASDGQGNLYSTECIYDCTESSLVRRITSTADVTTVAGDPNHHPRVRYGGMSVEGTGDAVLFNYAGAFAFDNSRKRIYILDYGANVRVATPTIPDTATVDYPIGVLGIASRLDVQPRSATSWSWSIIRRPTGSAANLSATNVANPTFTPDVADTYVFRVVATGANGSRISDVTLDAISCTFGLSAASGSSPALGTSGSFNVTTQSPCPWKAVSNVPWITVTPAAFTVGGGTVNYTVSATPLCSSRSGTVTVANQTFTINQAAASTYIAPLSQTIAAAGGPISVQISTGASCPWTATSNATWITITSGASGSGSAYVNFSVASNNVTGARTGTVTLAGKTFTLNQGGVDGGKVFALVNYFFGSGAEPPGSECNGDNVLTTADLFCLINYLFANGPAPTAP